MSTHWHQAYHRGNIFLRLICYKFGHLWSLGPENWYGARDGSQTRICTVCGRMEERNL